MDLLANTAILQHGGYAQSLVLRKLLGFARQHIHSQHLPQPFRASKGVRVVLHSLICAAHAVLIVQGEAGCGGVVGAITPQPVQPCMVVHKACKHQV